MKVCVAGDAVSGQDVHLERAVNPARVAAAVRAGEAIAGEPAIAVECRAPGPLHDRVGCIHSGISLRPRTALAVAGRTRGWTTAVDDEIAAVRAALADRPPAEVPNDGGARERIGDLEAEIERRREDVAAARGRRAAGGDADVEQAVRELSEVETEAAAIRATSKAERAAARSARDRLLARLRLRDRLGNLERKARRELVERARPRFVRALSGVSGADPGGKPFDAPPDAAALAIARVGDLQAPVVEASGRFETAAAAAEWLDAPVIRVVN